MYFFLSFLGLVLGSLSTRSVSWLSRLVSFLLYDCLRLRRRLVLRNLQIAFGEAKNRKELTRIGRTACNHFILTLFEFFRSARHRIDADVKIEGVANIENALAKGKGAYVLCCHLGNWEAMGAACTRAISPAHVLVKKVGRGGVNRFVEESRARNGFITIRREKKGDGMAAIRKILSQGEIVGFVMDQARPGEPRLPFFGRPAKTNTSLAAIWRKVPAPIVPAYIRRTGLGQHVLEFCPEVVLETSDDADKDILQHSALFNSIVESHVRKHPEQYFWMHNRWK